MARPGPVRQAPVRPAPARHLRVVAPRRRRRLRLTAFAVLSFTLVSVFGLVAFNVFIVQSQFRLERLQHRVDAEQAAYERLRLEEARLASPERILDLARTKLGMSEPRSITYLTAPARGAEGRGDPSQAVREWAEVKPYLAAQP